MNAEQIVQFTKYFFDKWFTQEDALPENIPAEEAAAILEDYLATYDHSDDNETWFGKIRTITEERGYAVRPKDYKKNPDATRATSAMSARLCAWRSPVAAIRRISGPSSRCSVRKKRSHA